MNSRDKAVAVASISSIVVGIGVTLFVWSRLGFDMNQATPVLTMILLCFLLTGAQALGPTPTCELEFLCGPRQVLVPAIGAGLMWLFQECGVDYTAFGASFGPSSSASLGLRDPHDGYLAIGIAAGYFAAEVYIMAAVWMRDPYDF